MKQCKLENNKDTVRERYSMIFDIMALLIVKETANNDDITGRKAMQADGIGRANTQFDGQCNFLCSPLFPLAIITSNSITKMAQRKSSMLKNLMSNGFLDLLHPVE